MAERNALRRPNPRLLVVRTILVLRSAWIVIGVVIALNAVLPSGWHTVLVAIGVYYAYTRVFQIFYDYIAIRYVANTRGVLVVRGVVGREEKRFGWESIVSVAVTQTVLQRVLRLADVRVNLSASEIASEMLPGVGIAESARLVRLHSQHRAMSAEPEPMEPSTLEPADSRPASAGTITPVLALADFLLIGIYSGAFVLFVPSVYSITAEMAAFIGPPALALPSIRDLGSVDAGVLGVLMVAVAMLSVAYGTCAAWVRYRRFAVVLRPNGDLVFSAGLSSNERRVIASDAVAAYELRHPLLMLPVRRAFLRAVVRGDGGHVTRGMLLPLTRASQGADMLGRLTGLSSRDLGSRIRSSRALASMVTIAGIGVSAVGIVAVFSLESAVVVAAGEVLLVRALDARIGSIRVATTASRRHWIVADRGILFRSTWAISSDAVDVSGWSGLSRRHGVLTMSIRGRRTTRLQVWPTSARVALHLRRAVEPSTPISFERNPG